MKTFLKWLKSLTSQQNINLTQNIQQKYPEIFWMAHPNLYVSIWMKGDFFKMNIIDFIAKYLDEMENDNTSKSRRNAISAVILPMYKEVTGRDYNIDYFKAITQ